MENERVNKENMSEETIDGHKNINTEENNQLKIERITLKLNKNEYEMLQQNGDSKVFLAEKVIDMPATESEYYELFLEQEIEKVGFFIKKIPEYKDIDKKLPKTTLKIFFSSKLSLNLISKHVPGDLKQVIIEPLRVPGEMPEQLTTVEKTQNNPERRFDNKILLYYLTKIKEIVEQVEPSLFVLKKNSENKALIIHILTNLHNLRVNARVFYIKKIEELTLELENILNNVFEKKVTYDEKLLQIVFSKLRQIKNLVNTELQKLKQNIQLDTGFQ